LKRIIYANSNHENCRYIQESIVSAQSFRKYVKDCEIVLYTNEKNFNHEVFDRVFYAEFIVPETIKHQDHKNGQMLVKHQAMIETTAEYNLVLGCDTLAVSEKVNSAFQLLDRFEITAAHAPTRIRKNVPDVPDAFPELNCDVIFFRKNEQTIELFKKWREMYRDNVFDHPHDQGTFRYLTYHSNIQLSVLPFEYNNRMGLYGKQSHNEEASFSQNVIIQNREIIAEMLAKNLDFETFIATKNKKMTKAKKILSKILGN
jgi:Nucleotide-diphospho-sugar transferase